MIDATGWERMRDALARAAREGGRPAPLSRRGRVFDAVLALALVLVCLRYAGTASASGAAVPATALPPALMVLRRRFPLAVLWAVPLAALAVRHVSPDVAFAEGAVCVVAAYGAAAYGRYPAPALGGLAVATAALVVLFDDAKLPHFPNGVVAVLVLVPVFAAAYELRMWRRRVDEGRARLARLEEERVEALRRAVERERARIARELHDVVTHNVSVMVIQTGAARKIMATDPDRAREALLAVETGGRTAMSELRHVMGLLTMESDGADAAAAADLAPQPGLGRLEALIDGVRRAGLPVDLTVTGTRRAVPPGVELAAYRVVQEALTNTVKHADGARTEVLVDYGTDELRVEVTDTGGRPGATAGTGGGRGLIGLRERLAVYGGTLRAGPRPTGGYRVGARIPLEDA